MNDGPSRQDSPGRNFIEKITHFLSNEPQSRKELVDMLITAQENELIDSEALSIFQGALQVSDMHVREIMVPLSQAITIGHDESVDSFLPKITESAHSRFPVYGEDKDQIVGILLAKDLLPLINENRLEKVTLKDLIREPSFVPESKRLNVLLREFRQKRTHMAIVINEYGVMSGLVTIEDVLEQIVGEIEDEHDFEDDYSIKHAEGNHYIVKALTPIDEFNNHFACNFSDDEFDTIGGLVTNKFGYLPKRDEQVMLDKFHFKILNADNRSIKLLDVKLEP